MTALLEAPGWAPVAPSPYRLLVTGSRSWTDYDTVRYEIGLVVTEVALAQENPYPLIVVVHGAARGADTLAAKAAEEFCLKQEPHPADYGRYGRRAPHVRNALIASLGAHRALAFCLPCDAPHCAGREPHLTHGTASAILACRRAGIDIKKIEAKP